MQHESLITLSFNSYGWLQQLKVSLLLDHFTLDGTFKNVTSEQKTLDLYRFTFAQHYDYPAISSHYKAPQKGGGEPVSYTHLTLPTTPYV